MKKLLLLFLVMMMCSCQKQTVKIENKMVQPDEIIMQLAQKYMSDSNNCYVGDGWEILDGDNYQENYSTGKYAYPIFQQDDIKYLMVVDDEIKFVPVDKNMSNILQGEFAVMQIGKAIYLLSDSQNELIAGIQEESDMKVMKKINSSAELLSKLSENKTKIVVDDVSSLYSKDRIVVKFKDGDTENYIAKYAAFCGGQLYLSNKTTETYVFIFREINYEQLKQLLQKTKDLDYVADAFLEKINSTDLPNNEVDI
ncbi:MAG: hypothetical protein Q4C64_04235 [Erysipelotrichia bacterium]|nr:hypothetical protein [Erysipelotrichia bacterium]